MLTIGDKCTEKPLVRNEAEGLLRQFSSLETAFMTTFWSFMLHRFNVTSKSIQAVVELYNSVIDFIAHVEGISILLEASGRKGQNYWVKWNLTSKAIQKEIFWRSIISRGRLITTWELQSKHILRHTILNQLDVELRKRCEVYTYFNRNFGFLMKISAMSPTDVSSAVHILSKEIPGHLEPDSLTKEYIHIASHIRNCDNQRHQKNATDML